MPGVTGHVVFWCVTVVRNWKRQSFEAFTNTPMGWWWSRFLRKTISLRLTESHGRRRPGEVTRWDFEWAVSTSGHQSQILRRDLVTAEVNMSTTSSWLGGKQGPAAKPLPPFWSVSEPDSLSRAPDLWPLQSCWIILLPFYQFRTLLRHVCGVTTPGVDMWVPLLQQFHTLPLGTNQSSLSGICVWCSSQEEATIIHEHRERPVFV